MSPARWPKKFTEVMVDTPIFTLRRDEVENPRTGGELSAYVLECPDWVNVIAVTADERIVLVRQYRHGVERVTLEIPGGVIDPGEDSQTAAARELLEETGYRASRMVALGYVDAQPAFQKNRCYTWLALGCEQVAEPTPDDGEDLRTVLVDLAGVEAMVAGGEINHGLVVAAFYRYHLYRSGLDLIGA